MLDGCVPWPAELAERYRQAGFWRGETLDDLLRRRAIERGDRPVASDATHRLSYAELDDAASRVATALSRAGIDPRDRVVVQLGNTVDFLTVFFGLQRAGAIPVLALPMHRRSEITHLCGLSGATGYVIPGHHPGFDYRGLAGDVRAALPELKVLIADELAAPSPSRNAEFPRTDPSDVALMLVSGGTTGLPKLIPRTHDDYVYNLRASAETCRLSGDDVYLAALPAAHNFALGCPGVLGTIDAGGAVVLTDIAAPDEAFETIQRERVSVTALVPPTARMWAEATAWSDEDLSSMRLLQVGGARLLPEHARLVTDAFGPVLQQVFGMAEGLLNFTEPGAPEEIVLHTQGRPLSPADEIRVVDENDDDVAPGDVGQLLTRGPYTPRGYYRAPEHNAASFTADGYYRTGDLVRVTRTGHLVVEGRVKDQINRGGDKIAAAEVEEHLVAHPAVADAAVVATPDELLGERSCAFVIPAPGVTPPDRAELAAFLSDRGVAAFKIPDRVEVVESFPVTTVGKTDKRALAERIGATA
ncbi:(2,3-dihydroxybenzoyl)adenylate synthase [Phytoactinopolyspora halotolerans]|uniref:AMP-binding protein n=1 Tax=Phytoactinopolyspora halotolerans TaxID=1981512 RepID=A0A6L9SDW0_9ACTN|nr:AMP-binding protein [Phytoactinopolyspora halotolerans]